jgi:formamidopyrimidine-DNA glycosylase
MMRGQKWYRPKKPCPRCGLMVKKPTSNGKCPGCTLREETWIMIKNAPDMVISSDHARKLKLQVYRTGKPCRNGHTGFKMISTNDCIDCLKKGDI